MTGAEHDRQVAAVCASLRLAPDRCDRQFEAHLQPVREPIHGDDLPRPADMPDVPMAGDRW